MQNKEKIVKNGKTTIYWLLDVVGSIQLVETYNIDNNWAAISFEQKYVNV